MIAHLALQYVRPFARFAIAISKHAIRATRLTNIPLTGSFFSDIAFPNPPAFPSPPPPTPLSADCPKRVTWGANLEKHCEDNGHVADEDSEPRFIRSFFSLYGAASRPLSPHSSATTDVDGGPPDLATAALTASNAAPEVGRKAKRKGKEREFKLDDVPWNLRPCVDEDLCEYVTSRKVSARLSKTRVYIDTRKHLFHESPSRPFPQLPRSALTLDEYRMRLDSYFFGNCLMDPDRPPSHSVSQAFIIECAICENFCSQTDYWTHIYGEHLRVAPFACHGYVSPFLARRVYVSSFLARHGYVRPFLSS